MEVYGLEVWKFGVLEQSNGVEDLNLELQIASSPLSHRDFRI